VAVISASGLFTLPRCDSFSFLLNVVQLLVFGPPRGSHKFAPPVSSLPAIIPSGHEEKRFSRSYGCSPVAPPFLSCFVDPKYCAVSRLSCRDFSLSGFFGGFSFPPPRGDKIPNGPPRRLFSLESDLVVFLGVAVPVQAAAPVVLMFRWAQLATL